MHEKFDPVRQEVIARNEDRFRDERGRLPEQKLFDLLASVGNAEHKALELLVMWNGGVGREIFTSGSLFNRVMDHQIKTGGWNMASSLPFNHCEKSFAPIGLVAQEYISGGTEWGYQITDFGIKEGMPLAGLLLKWSFDHPELSSYGIFGSTHSNTLKREEQSKRRSPEARYKILYELITFPENKKIEIKDIADTIELARSNISKHASELSRSGVLTYESAEYGMPVSHWKAKKDVPIDNQNPPKKYPNLTQDLWSILKSLPNNFISAEQVLLEFTKRYPQKKIHHFDNISRALSYLQREGYVERRKFGNEFRSEIKLSDEQRETIKSLIDLIDKFASGDKATIEQGKAFARKVFTDKGLFANLMLKAKESSPHANFFSKEEMNSNILALLWGNPNATGKEIREIFVNKYKKISRLRINVFLRDLASQGKIIAAESKQGNRYSINPNYEKDRLEGEKIN